MSLDAEHTSRQIPSLVQICQRIASSNVERIHSVGDGIRFEILKPVLHHCTAGTLLRLEHASSYLENETSDLWRDLCYRTFPLAAQQRNADAAPDSWRDQYFILQDLETKRLEELGTRLRVQREEKALRKKESKIKITDKLPPQKRSRGWGPTQPKTLFQKTRSDTAKLQKGFYGKPIAPAVHNPKSFRAPSAQMSPPPSSASSSSSSTSGSRVTVAAVAVRRPSTDTKPSPTTPNIPSHASPPISPAASSHLPGSHIQTNPMGTGALQDGLPCLGEDRPMPLKPPLSRQKKDPMTSLFMPKNRPLSRPAVSSLSTVRSKS